ncbi:hypothetical protein [Kitasatospora sp. NPDC047058]|uniref:hypothetical protein n=1 Tax=Kitasatospora sp. NPDC047058 TaxID=3155620 RepID=UPI0033E8BBDA
MTDTHAHHRGEIRLQRSGMEHRETSGATTWWPDGTTSYVLHFKGPHSVWTIADEADTVIKAVEDLHSGEEMSKSLLQSRLRDTRRLLTRLNAIEEELLLYAREAGPDGEPRLSWREIGEEMGLHFTTARERHKRAASGQGAPCRHWLVQHTHRDQMYPTADGQPAVPPKASDAEPETEPGTAAHES